MCVCLCVCICLSMCVSVCRVWCYPQLLASIGSCGSQSLWNRMFLKSELTNLLVTSNPWLWLFKILHQADYGVQSQATPSKIEAKLWRWGDFIVNFWVIWFILYEIQTLMHFQSYISTWFTQAGIYVKKAASIAKAIFLWWYKDLENLTNVIGDLYPRLMCYRDTRLTELREYPGWL